MTNYLNPKDIMMACDEALGSITPVTIDPVEIQRSGKHKTFYHILRDMFRNYFAGKPALKDVFIFTSDEELIDNAFKYYLALYNVFNLGWGEIEEGFANVEMPVSSPGEALIYILKGDATQRWNNRDKSANPKALYLAFKQFDKCKLLQQQGNLSVEQEKKLNSLVQRIKKKHPDKVLTEHSLFEDICIDICLKSKRKGIRTQAQKLQEASQERGEEIARRLRALL